MPGLDWGQGHYENLAAQLLPASEAVVEAAAPAPGERVVDVGCGTGNAALLAAGGGARVTGVDPAPRLIEVAAAEALDRGFEAEFVLGEASSIPLGDDSANLVLSVFGAIFDPDPGAAVAEMARVCAPGGRIVQSVWVPGGALADAARTAREAIAAAIGEDPPGEAFPWHERKALEELFGPHGFAVELEERSLTFTAGSPREFAATEIDSHPLWVAGREALVAAGTDEAVRRRVLEIFEQGNEDPDGFRETSRYAIVTATRAG